MKTEHAKTRRLVEVALFSAIVVVLATVPFLGYIPLGFINATTIHIPVILASVLLGPKEGAMVGGVFGLTSLVKNTVQPNLTSFVFTPFYAVGDVSGNFWSLVICLAPRILVGVVPYFVYRLVKKVAGRSEALPLAADVYKRQPGGQSDDPLLSDSERREPEIGRRTARRGEAAHILRRNGDSDETG